jgi:hypothetical protein
VGEAVGERRGGERARVDSGGEDWYGAKFMAIFWVDCLRSAWWDKMHKVNLYLSSGVVV